jgi:hypothetical protein
MSLKAMSWMKMNSKSWRAMSWSLMMRSLSLTKKSLKSWKAMS